MPLPKRKVIEGVPRVQFYAGGPRPPEDDTFSACLTSLLQQRGDDLGLGRPGMTEDEKWHEVHCFFVGMGGSAFKLAFDDSFDLSTTSLRAGVPSLRSSITRAIEGAGYEAAVVLQKASGQDTADSWSEEQLRKAASQSLVKGWPIVAVGLAGPPEFSIVTGWDDSMDTLIGWSFFQDDPEFGMDLEKEPDGQFRVTDWFKYLEAMILMGAKVASRSPQAHRKGLEAGLSLLQSCTAYGAWQEALISPDHWPSGSDQALRRSHAYHWQTAGTLAEDRAWGAVFLKQAASAYPEAAQDLMEAHRCFMNIHDLVWAVWEFSGPFPSMESGAPRFADASRRQRVAPLIGLMAEQDERAARLISSALAKMGETSTAAL